MSPDGCRGLQFGDERVHRVRRALDADDAGELSGEPGHAAFQPVSAVAGDGVGEGVHKSGAVAAEHRHDDGRIFMTLGKQGGRGMPEKFKGRSFREA